MKKVILFVLLINACNLFSQVNKGTLTFIPNGYVFYEAYSGDLNKDGLKDSVIIIKGTDKAKFVEVENRGILNRNRRGILVLFNKKTHYELVTKNLACFSSENEDGGVYFPPDLSFEIKKGNLYVQYGHGRYGYWSYTFRHQNANFELIGYDNQSGGPITESVTSINFSTKTKIEKKNTNYGTEGAEEVFKTTTKKIKINQLIKLSEIKDFDELNMYSY